MMNKSKKYIAIAFVVVLIVVVIVSTVGILSLKNKPEILQGQAEATEIRISGKQERGGLRKSENRRRHPQADRRIGLPALDEK